jgi:hypothetical protein
MSSADRTAVTDADFYLLEPSLDDAGRQLLRQVREFMEKSVQPVINHYWTREEFRTTRCLACASSASRA